jgi:hypothetical protein
MKVIRLTNTIKEIQKIYLARTMFFLVIGKTPTYLFQPFSSSATNKPVGIDANPIGFIIDRNIVPDSLPKIVTSSNTSAMSILFTTPTLFKIS